MHPMPGINPRCPQSLATAYETVKTKSFMADISWNICKFPEIGVPPNHPF